MSSEHSPPKPIEITQELARRLREDGPASFRALYERIAPSLFAWARIRAGVDGTVRADPEDLMQEVWLRALEEINEYDPTRATFRAWIFGIAKNVLYEQWRQRGGRAPNPRATDASAALEAWPDVATTIRTKLVRDEAIELLLAHAEKLDPIDKKLLLSCGFEDMSCTEAATRFGIGADAAIKRWQRLREHLAERGFGEILELRAAS
jgi:RNA polymerase sigma-70 factor (ECF subfamily)